MTKWEYFTTKVGEGFLSLEEIGNQEYELVCINKGIMYFKRPLEEPNVFKDGIKMHIKKGPESIRLGGAFTVRGKYNYESVQDGYVIFGPDGRKIPGYEVEQMLNKESL